jgi:hypothetical protein
MATLQQMLDKYGQRETARILQYEGYPVSQPRISEALRARKNRSEASAEAKYYEIDAYARRVNLRKYPKGVPDGINVVDAVRLRPPVYTYYYQTRSWTHVTRTDTGNPPHLAHDGSLSWPRPQLTVPQWSTEKIVAMAVEKFGRKSHDVAVRIYGTFEADFGKYSSSIRFPGFRESYYVARVALSDVRSALRKEQSNTVQAMRGVSSTNNKARNAYDIGSPPGDPGFSARWATLFMPVKFVEVNYIDIALPYDKETYFPRKQALGRAWRAKHAKGKKS